MTKKQKNVFYRILLSVVLIVGIGVLTTFVSVNIYVEIVLYLIPYLVIGYDILRKAIKGILKRQVFDENFLMAVATVGAMCLGEFRRRCCGYGVLSDWRVVSKCSGWKESS